MLTRPSSWCRLWRRLILLPGWYRSNFLNITIRKADKVIAKIYHRRLSSRTSPWLSSAGKVNCTALYLRRNNESTSFFNKGFHKWRIFSMWRDFCCWHFVNICPVRPANKQTINTYTNEKAQIKCIQQWKITKRVRKQQEFFKQIVRPQKLENLV